MLEDKIRTRTLELLDALENFPDDRVASLASFVDRWQDELTPERVLAAMSVIAATREASRYMNMETREGMDAEDRFERALAAWDALEDEHA